MKQNSLKVMLEKEIENTIKPLIKELITNY